MPLWGREAARIALEEAKKAAPKQTAAPAKAAAAARAAAREEKAAAEKDKQLARNWILQYAEEQTDSDDEGNQVRFADSGAPGHRASHSEADSSACLSREDFKKCTGGEQKGSAASLTI